MQAGARAAQHARDIVQYCIRVALLLCRCRDGIFDNISESSFSMKVLCQPVQTWLGMLQAERRQRKVMSYIDSCST